MKTHTLYFTALFLTGILTACGSGEPRSESEDKTEVADNQEKVDVEDTPDVVVHDPQSLGDLGKEGLEALVAHDIGRVKELVQRNVSYYVDDDFIQYQSGKIDDWDGEIRGVKFRKAEMTGRPEAVVYFDEVDDKNIQVHILDYFNEDWHILGGSYGIEEVSLEEFEGYDDIMEGVMD